MKKRHLLDLTPDQFAGIAAELGEPGYRAKQLADWVLAKRVATWDEMKNLPKAFRDKLAERFFLRSMAPVRSQKSDNGLTEKWLLRTQDGHGVECVLIREAERRTACVSCSIGCPMGCVFCASAGPLSRHLTTGEIVEEVAHIEAATGERVTNVVFMGTGEPFLNYDAVLAAARMFNHPDVFGIGARHITISTVGVVTGIERFIAEPEDFRLALSLHAPGQRTRQRIIPSANKWPIQRIFDVLRRYTRQTRREVTIEYTLIDGVNSGPDDASALAAALDGIPCKVNCIPLNPVPGRSFAPPSDRQCHEFAGILSSKGLRATLRLEKGRDIAAACGQLRAVTDCPKSE